jgi:electron transfer flavoprotein alpha subunit
MSVIVYTEAAKGKIRKNSLEAVTYAAAIAAKVGGEVVAVIDAAVEAALHADLGKAGAQKVLTVNHTALSAGDARAWAAVMEQVAQAHGVKVVVFSHDLAGKDIAPRVAVRLKAGIVAGAVDFPTIDGGKFEVRKTAFSGKATAVYSINSDVKVITLLPNSIPVGASGAAVSVSAFDAKLDGITSGVTIKERKTRQSTTVPLPEAELVVSAGRGLKASENWGIVEDLATALGATTACSRPVADMHWRPHHEHVGQTGVAIRPNLYIAIGISGAIQHLAGVNGSKTIVVINNDKEAPFFKAADYGVVGDAFEILPKLTEAVKKFKASQN